MPVQMLIGDNWSYTEVRWWTKPTNFYNDWLGRRSMCYCCSYVGAENTTQSLWETLVGILKKCCCHQNHCGCMACTALLASHYLTVHFIQLSKWLVAQCSCSGSIISYQKCVVNRCSLCVNGIHNLVTFVGGKYFTLCTRWGLILSLSTWTIDTSMITASSCLVKLE